MHEDTIHGGCQYEEEILMISDEEFENMAHKIEHSPESIMNINLSTSVSKPIPTKTLSQRQRPFSQPRSASRRGFIPITPQRDNASPDHKRLTPPCQQSSFLPSSPVSPFDFQEESLLEEILQDDTFPDPQIPRDPEILELYLSLVQASDSVQI
eukprot:gnl/Trimastix_PCT/3988.p1 GENE.gnl/Trimastix_PCT/3988~~gnl/Trimastix_PCT/3988.p1  ORF type:complete len:154 (+),score=14.41 gnl/Trimastix_PCT/3988:430-891(+)